MVRSRLDTQLIGGHPAITGSTVDVLDSAKPLGRVFSVEYIFDSSCASSGSSGFTFSLWGGLGIIISDLWLGDSDNSLLHGGWDDFGGDGCLKKTKIKSEFK